MSEYNPYTGTIPGCRMRLIRVRTDKFKTHDVLARFAKNIAGVTCWKEIRPVKCDRVFCLKLEG